MIDWPAPARPDPAVLITFFLRRPRFRDASFSLVRRGSGSIRWLFLTFGTPSLYFSPGRLFDSLVAIASSQSLLSRPTPTPSAGLIVSARGMNFRFRVSLHAILFQA
jgi:hypothetical protein